MDNTQDYYAGRCRKAREMASAAADQSIAKIHEEMADRYEGLAESTERARPTVVQD